MDRPLEIVVVDDEEQITELLKTFIQITAEKAHVHTFNDSQAARDFVLRNDVDIIITDYKMPNYDGIQLLEAAPANVKKILISGYVSEIAEEKLAKMDVLFFEKPVPMRTLRRIIIEEQAGVAGRPA